ncbi:MAG: hypothetical protein H7832_05490 [Magnetococcus sp. DMHC-6]
MHQNINRSSRVAQNELGLEMEEALLVLEAGPTNPAFDLAWEAVALSKDPIVRRAIRLTMEEFFGPPPDPHRL